MHKKVVVVAGQSGAEIVEEFHREGYQVLLVCGKEGEAGADLAEELVVKDLSQIEEVYTSFADYSKLVFFGTGHFLAIDLAHYCVKMGCTINFDHEAAALFKNKLKTHRYVNQLGYLSPLIYVVSDQGDSYLPDSWPVVLKSEQDTYKTEMVDSVQDFMRVRDAMLATGSQVLVERFIDGYEVTLPVIAEKGSVRALPAALDMQGINEKAVSILKGFDLKREDKKSVGIATVVTPEMKAKIASAAEDIISQAGFYGYPRFDIMVEGNEFYILEINSIMVSALGGTHYPWESVGLNPARDMVQLFIKNLN